MYRFMSITVFNTQSGQSVLSNGKRPKYAVWVTDTVH